MRDFHCPNCGQRLAFENSACLSCGSALGFSLGRMALLVIADDADVQLCANLHLAQCNWLVPSDQLGGLSPPACRAAARWGFLLGGWRCWSSPTATMCN
ncbi:hypothetical protein Z584_03595, partial [Mycobacterium tuberculosis variant bovis B2 7505]